MDFENWDRRRADLLAEIDDPLEDVALVPSWKERALVLLASHPDVPSATQDRFAELTERMYLPAPELAESWDVWQYEQVFREAKAILEALPIPLTRPTVTVSDPGAVAEVMNEFVDLLKRHFRLWSALRSTSGSARTALQEQYRAAEIEILGRQAQVAAIAQRLQPDLTDLIRFRVHSSPRNWKYQAVLTSAEILKGAVERLKKTEEMLGPAPEPHSVLSTPRQRMNYGLALLAEGAVDPTRPASSKEIGDQLGLSEEMLHDVETWLHGAGLIRFVTFGPTVCLTHAGREWAEGGASLDAPPAGSTTNVFNIGPGASVENIQAAGNASSQVANVVVDQRLAVQNWMQEVESWLEAAAITDVVRTEVRAHLAHLGEELAEEVPRPTRVRSGLSRIRSAITSVATATAGSLGADGLIEAADHLQTLW